jgi:outer membrane protein assembly factor BamA
MWRGRVLPCLIVIAHLATFVHAECRKDHRSNKNAGLLISDLVLNGTHAVSSSELSRIAGDLAGSCFDENSEELQERIKSLFLDKGYFECQVENVRIKANDPLTIPKPVSVEATVSEGRRFKIGQVEFEGNHVFESSELRAKFPLKTGDVFARNKIGEGLEAVRTLYSPIGFIDFFLVPDVVKSSDGTLMLKVTVTEGRQYHMGKLEIFAKKELADKLRARWEIQEGALFDHTYIEKYINRNRTLLPAEFNGVNAQIVRDCRNSIVEVRLPVDGTDPRGQTVPKDIDCEEEQSSSNKN